MAAAELLIMPSYFESLSMVALEAWALGRPVLANAKCDVLKGQCIRSNAGLYYDGRDEFIETLRADRAQSLARRQPGPQRPCSSIRDHYDWPVIERKYLDMIEQLSSGAAGAGTSTPLPGMVRSAQGRIVRPRREVVAALPSGPSLSPDAVQPRPPITTPPLPRRPAADGRRQPRGVTARPRPLVDRDSRRRLPVAAPGGSIAGRRASMSRIDRPAVHQVLATLGYGDAIGHEVLGIQRVLRGAGYRSDIFVETADPRLEPLTRDYRELVDASAADNLLLHHFSIGSKASRTAYALPDRMALIYHNITPPEYFASVHRTLARQCFRGRREIHAYVDRCDLAMGDSEFNRQDLETLGFPRTAVLPVVPDFAHLDDAAGPVRRAAVRRRVDQHRVRRPGDRATRRSRI